MVDTVPDKAMQIRRLYAFGLDMLFVSIISKAIMLAFLDFFHANLYHPSMINARNMHDFLPVAQMTITALLVIFYFTFCYYTARGQTAAKLLLGLQVKSSVHPEGLLSLKESFLRALGYLCGLALGGVPLILPLIRQDLKGFPDWFSGTTVIWENEAEKIDETVAQQPQMELFEEEDDKDNDQSTAA